MLKKNPLKTLLFFHLTVTENQTAVYIYGMLRATHTRAARMQPDQKRAFPSAYHCLTRRAGRAPHALLLIVLFSVSSATSFQRQNSTRSII
jgi:hypothetical protein